MLEICPDLVNGGLGGAITVIAAGAVVLYRTDAAGNDSDLGAF